MEWMYIVSDDQLLPILLGTRLDSCPSVVFCPLHRVHSVMDLAESVANQLQHSENIPAIPWGDIGLRWHDMVPLFQKKIAMHDDSDHEEREMTPPPPPTPEPKPRATKPKPKPKVPKPPPVEPAKPPARGEEAQADCSRSRTGGHTIAATTTDSRRPDD